jgi:hypothetical protein
LRSHKCNCSYWLLAGPSIITGQPWSVNHYRSAFLKAYAPLTFPCRFFLGCFSDLWVSARSHCSIARVHNQSVTHSLTRRSHRRTERQTALHCTANSKRNKAVAVRMPRQTWDVFRLQKVFGKKSCSTFVVIW